MVRWNAVGRSGVALSGTKTFAGPFCEAKTEDEKMKRLVGQLSSNVSIKALSSDVKWMSSHSTRWLHCFCHLSTKTEILVESMLGAASCPCRLAMQLLPRTQHATT